MAIKDQSWGRYQLRVPDQIMRQMRHTRRQVVRVIGMTDQQIDLTYQLLLHRLIQVVGQVGGGDIVRAIQ